MKKLTKYLIIAAIMLAAVAYAWYSGFKYSLNKRVVEENSELVLDRVKKVTKLVAVEGYFSEIYEHKDYMRWDISFLRKKAMIRVKAKVSVGFDFDTMQITTNEETKTITIDAFPEPSVIAIDHELDYFDIDEGTFNSFSEKDYNRLNKNAKDIIKKKAMNSELQTAAYEREIELKEMLHFICQSMGWKLEIKEAKNRAPYQG